VAIAKSGQFWRVPNEPPAFRIEGEMPEVVELPDQAPVVSWQLIPQPLGGALQHDRLAFRVGFIDANRDGRPDDENQDGVPDLYPLVFLHFLPRPGQDPATVVVPFQFNPAPFLTLLGGDVKTEIAVDRLQIFLVPQAEEITYQGGTGRQVKALGAIPVGDYELVAIAKSGQFWRVPNALGQSTKVNGPWADQNVHFRFVHGGAQLDAGSLPRFDGGLPRLDGGFPFRDAGP